MELRRGIAGIYGTKGEMIRVPFDFPENVKGRLRGLDILAHQRGKLSAFEWVV